MGFGAAAERGALFARLAEESFDLLVVGGGITGAGIARDAIMRGLTVALVDKDDFAYGTSSRSSRLIHGGLRYLEQMQFGMVHESLSERARLMRLAPHLARPLPFFFPIFAGQKPGVFVMRAGMVLYDMLAAFRTYRNHRYLRGAAATEAEPGLRTDGLRGAFLYYDCHTDDGRLTLENIIEANDLGAACLNYCEAVRARFSDDSAGALEAVVVRDALTGREVVVRAAVMVVAAGLWTDAVHERVVGAPSDPPRRPMLAPSKGVHIVVPHARVPVRHAVVMTTHDKRITFCIPWGPLTYIGTTDNVTDEDGDQVRARPEDIAYLLDTVNAHFPAVHLTAADITNTWAGLRPLIAQDAASYRASREHEIRTDPRGIVTVAGGKLTTYRTMADEVLGRALPLLRARSRAAAARACETAQRPLLGGRGLDSRDPWSALDEQLAATAPALDAATRRHLMETYGARATAVVERAGQTPDGLEPICPGLTPLWAEVDFAATEEMVVHLTDFLVRRSRLFFEAPNQAEELAPAVAARLARHLGWSSDTEAAEVAAFARVAAAHRAWRTDAE